MLSFGHSGSAPSPFDGSNGGRLAGGQGSHPLHDVRIEELLNPGDGSLAGRIAVDGGVAMVGEPISIGGSCWMTPSSGRSRSPDALAYLTKSD